jgi:hypothetical protein
MASVKDAFVAVNMDLPVALFNRMLVLYAWITIGKWMCWLPSIPYCTPTEQEVKGRTSLVGSISQREV